MKLFFAMVSVLFLFVACNKETAVIETPAAQVSYKIEIQLLWISPKFTVPAYAHFTNFIGMVHTKDSFLWAPNGLATTGLEFVAEVGSNGQLNKEIDSIIAKGKALSAFQILPPAIDGRYDTTFNFTLQYSSISFASMIAPSPDWFIGLNKYNLLQNGSWVKDITVPLYGYDAGTEDGDVFGYNNPETNPRQSIHLLTAANASVLANGNAQLAPMGNIRFIKL